MTEQSSPSETRAANEQTQNDAQASPETEASVVAESERAEEVTPTAESAAAGDAPASGAQAAQAAQAAPAAHVADGAGPDAAEPSAPDAVPAPAAEAASAGPDAAPAADAAPAGPDATGETATAPQPERAEAPAQPAAPAADAASAEPGGADEIAAAAPHGAPAERPHPTPSPADARPGPRAVPRPVPRPKVPAAAAPVAAPPVPPVDAHDAAEAAAWGRVDDDGTVWVREATGERVVGQYTGADREEALGFYVRRFLDLQAQVALFEARLPQLSGKEIDQTLATLTDALKEPTAVGDLDGLRTRLDRVRAAAEERRAEAAAEREAARARAVADRTAIVEQAEKVAAQDPTRTQWKQSGERLRDLLDQWKNAQRTGPRLDRPTEDALWKRFSHARTAFDRHRRQYFSELDASQAQVKDAKEQLIARAEELAASTDWGRTTAAYRQLMDEWKAAGRASRKDDDALWARFRAAQQRFFDARNAQNAEIDAEYSENLKVKLALLEQAEALVPVTDVKAAKAALRPLQDKWDAAGKVPRADVQRVEGRMRAVEQAVRDAEQAAWQRTDPEKKARAEGAAAQLEAAIAGLEADLARARETGDESQIAEAQTALDARRAWLDQVQRTARD
ncbi:DUF349 domain-containing protein [Georgenia ruanii]|uniref:DUF349 domain-containing protein n=1 Tax=Georgenia ruanii TaxID=348442 RepID=UPI001D0241DF|nr:DUF349 domain-containing protein [Georgenia ruanii]